MSDNDTSAVHKRAETTEDDPTPQRRFKVSLEINLGVLVAVVGIILATVFNVINLHLKIDEAQKALSRQVQKG